VASPLPQTTPVASAAAAAASGPFTPQSALQTELQRIKQRIRVWDVTSPLKTTTAAGPARAGETRLTTPDKLPKYTEAEMTAARAAAELAAKAENERLRTSFLELQRQYEKEKSVSTQLKEIVEEFESTVRVMVEGHAKQLEAERAAAGQLMAQNAELLEMVEDRQRKCDALQRERMEISKVPSPFASLLVECARPLPTLLFFRCAFAVRTPLAPWCLLTSSSSWNVLSASIPALLCFRCAFASPLTPCGTCLSTSNTALLPLFAPSLWKFPVTLLPMCD
jgi:hypothetical protein